MQRFCVNDILDGVDEFIESIFFLLEFEKILYIEDIDYQYNVSYGEEEVLKEDFFRNFLEERKLD